MLLIVLTSLSLTGAGTPIGDYASWHQALRNDGASTEAAQELLKITSQVSGLTSKQLKNCSLILGAYASASASDGDTPPGADYDALRPSLSKRALECAKTFHEQSPNEYEGYTLMSSALHAWNRYGGDEKSGYQQNADLAKEAFTKFPNNPQAFATYEVVYGPLLTADERVSLAQRGMVLKKSSRDSRWHYLQVLKENGRIEKYEQEMARYFAGIKSCDDIDQAGWVGPYSEIMGELVAYLNSQHNEAEESRLRKLIASCSWKADGDSPDVEADILLQKHWKVLPPPFPISDRRFNAGHYSAKLRAQLKDSKR